MSRRARKASLPRARVVRIKPMRPDPPALKRRLVSALGGEVSDMGLLPQEVRYLRTEVGEMRSDMRGVRGDLKTLIEQLAPVIADHGERITSLERRVAALESTKRRKARSPV